MGKKREKLYTFIGVTFYFEFILELITEFHSLCKTKENTQCLLSVHDTKIFLLRFSLAWYVLYTG